MMRRKFHEELSKLNREMIAMGGLCETAIAVTAKAFLEGDPTVLSTTAALLEDIDRKEHDVEQLCLKLLLEQQPVARDLRTISAALKMVTDMERIGDQSADIAEILATVPAVSGNDTAGIRQMAEGTIHMVSEAIAAFVSKDAATAAEVIRYDDVVDRAFDEVKSALIRRLRCRRSDEENTLDLLMIAKYFERIGDHAVNIARWVLFSVSGKREIQKKDL